ncbi:MAG: EthD family reductase [Betaproteobacteria bacterium]|nr:MAG: EthD family reductase [Betaproteobacteria bacterium]
MFSLFLTFYAGDAAARVSAADFEKVCAIARGLPGLRRGLLFTPERAPDPFADYPPPPQLALQLYFPEIALLEAAAGPGGGLKALADPGALPSVDMRGASQQAMLVRAFPVPDAAFRTPPGAAPCSDIIHYPGAAEDFDAWLAFYLASHVPLMQRLPGIRELEIYTRIDWTSALPWPKAEHIQRNKVVFDDAAALEAALRSPVRAEMRADFLRFPFFTGGNRHNPMATHEIIGQH